MEFYFLVKTLHVLSSTVVFGTGLGIAFFMLRSRVAADSEAKLFAARNTVLADYCFTAPAVVLQPLTGLMLIHLGGFDPMADWLVATYVIYGVAALCWLLVVWIQLQLKQMCCGAVEQGAPLSPRYFKLFKLWFLLGWPAFMGLVYIFYLMVAKPV